MPPPTHTTTGPPPQDGKGPLHVCGTREVAKSLLDFDRALLGQTDNQGRTPYEVQNAEVRAVIDELTLFCGCYDLGSVATPEHATPTSVVLRAVDKRAANVGTAQEVAIKAMMNEEQFIRGAHARSDPCCVSFL